MFKSYLKVNRPVMKTKTRPITDGVKLWAGSRRSCSVCGTRTPEINKNKVSCFSCGKVLCGHCRVTNASEFALDNGNKKGLCSSCFDLVQLLEDSETDDDVDDLEEDEEVSVGDNFVSVSGFASLVGDNMKLVYLKKSLVEELIKEQPECWERKVVGSFVRVKTSPFDYSTTSPYQLVLVEGVIKKSSKGEILLQVRPNNVPRDVPVSGISDDDFTEEDCEDLRRDVANCGGLKRLGVFEREEKARELHEDITKHWIRRELVRLQNCVDRANEKGRRSELLVYLEKREELKQACEQERLLKQAPEVIADLL